MSRRQQRVDKNLFEQILSALKLGPQVSEADRSLARGQANEFYDAANENVGRNLAATGYGESGKMGTGVRRSQSL